MIKIHATSLLLAVVGTLSTEAIGRTVNANEFRLSRYSSVSKDGKSLVLDSTSAAKEFGWRRYAYAGCDGFLDGGVRYSLSFKVRLEAAGDAARALVLIRPAGESSHTYDCGSSAIIPTGGRWKTVNFNFTTGERRDYCIQLHSWNRIRAEFKDIRLEKTKPLKFVPVGGESRRYEIDVSVEPRGAKDFSVDLPRSQGGLVLNVSDFGASETNVDNTAAFRSALAAARSRRASRLEVPRGVYRFMSDSPISLREHSDFTFDGGGSVFISYRRNGRFLDIENCTRVHVLDFSLDWDWSRTPLASLVKVESANGKTADLKFVDYDAFPDKQAFFTCASPFDPATRSVGLEDRKTFIFDRFYCRERTVKAEWIAPDTVRLPMGVNGMKTGELYRLQHYYYHMGGIWMQSNAHLSLERIRILSTPGHAFRISGTQHHTHFRKVDIVAPVNDVRRIITCTGDHLHLATSRGYIKIENCEFSLGGDDIFNMHDITAYAEKNGPKSLRVLNSPHNYGKLPKGTKVELRNADYSPSGHICTVAKAKRSTGRTAILYFDESVPGETGDGFILFDRRYDTHNVIVRDCVFRDNRARGILIGARDVTLERNVFRHHEAGAIKIDTGFTLGNWSEGYGSTNIVVRNNVFDRVNPSGIPVSQRQRSIYTGVYLKTDPSNDTTSYPIIRDVLFEGNEFRESTGVAAYLTSIKNVTFRDNVFVDCVPRIGELPYRSQFYLENARDVKIVNNRWVKSPCVKNPGVVWDPGTCENVVIQGNSVVAERFGSFK